MIRGALLVTAAAAALVLTPSVAMAYNAPGYSSSVSDSTPTAGHPVTMTVRGLPANARQVVKFVITSKSGVKKTVYVRADGNGTARFTFKLSATGTYKVQAFNSKGDLLSDQVLTVSRNRGNGNDNGHGNNNGHGNGHKPGDGRGRVAPASSPINFAGLDGAGLAAGGGLLLIPGAGAMLVARRRRSAKVSADRRRIRT